MGRGFGLQGKYGVKGLLFLGAMVVAAALGSWLTLAFTGTLNLAFSEPEQPEVLLPAGDMAANDDDANVAIDALVSNEQIAERMASSDSLLLQLQQELADASLERGQLADSIAQLNRQLESFESDLINQSARLEQRGDQLANAVTADSASGAPDSNRFDFGREPDSADRYDSLVAAGVDSQTASELQTRQDQFQLSRLELFDQAQREGWIDSDEFDDRLEELEDQQVDLRSELGDVAYDRYLYELGRSNRVIISSIISGSAAQQVGLQRGDLILSYANERIFNTADLQSATRAGLRGESVSISYERGGQLLAVEMPRGPLGVTLTMSRREPS